MTRWERIQRRYAGIGVLAIVLAAGLAVGVAACDDDDKKPETLTLKATDFAFAADGSPKRGVVKVMMPNEGEYEHHVQFFLVEGDHSAEELIEAVGAAMEEGAEFPEWATWWGGPGILSPGETAEHYIDFDEGRYIYLCFLEDPDGEPHFAKGMLGEVTFEGKKSSAKFPAAKVEVTGEDDSKGQSYAFGLPESIKSGDSLGSFKNNGSEPHEMQLARVSGDMTVEKTVSVFLEETEPPADFEYLALGGPQVIMPGESTSMRIDLKPGRYVFICFLPSPEGAPHAALGMAAAIEVK